MPFKDMHDIRKGESSKAIKTRVDRTRTVQKKRYQQNAGVHCNAQMGTAEIEQHCRLDQASQKLLEKSVDKLGLSARAYHRILKIARTIADMDNKEHLELSHVAEAVQYRRTG